jgi:Domain of unknown function (DUF3471)
VIWFPAEQLGVCVLANLGDVPVSSLAYQVADLVLGVEAPEEQTAGPKAERSEISVDGERLASYVGRYQHATGATVEVKLEDSTLWIHSRGTANHARAYAPDHFFFDDTDMTVSFARDWNGSPTKLRVHVGDQVYRMNRVQTALDTGVDLSVYVGRYWSEELGAFYDLEVMDGVLTARHRRHGDIPLRASGEDSFSGSRWFFQRLAFERDSDGAVRAFRLSAGRVRNLLFERQAR